MHIKVGDKVKLKNSPHLERDVLYIHQNPGDGRKYYVVAYKGDIPTSHPEHELTKVPDLIEKTYSIKKKWIYNCAADADDASHGLIISYLDDEPVSARLEKL